MPNYCFMKIEKSIGELRKKDPILGEIIDRVGIIELKPSRAPFESLVNSIVSQQLSTRAAATIHKRLLQLLENDITPHRILRTPAGALREAGLSGQKAKYMAALAEAFIDRKEAFERIHKLPDAEVIELLTSVKGIGVWTAQMFMMFDLLREDIFPVGDLGIRRSMEKHFFGGEKQDHPTLIKRAAVWSPHRTVASFYLWRGWDL